MKGYGVEATIRPVRGVPVYKLPEEDGGPTYYIRHPSPLCVCREDVPEMHICIECVHHGRAKGWFMRSMCFVARDDLGFDAVRHELYPFCDEVNKEGSCSEYLEKEEEVR